MRSCGTSGLDLKSWALEEAIPHNCPKFALGNKVGNRSVEHFLHRSMFGLDLKSWVLQKAIPHTSHEVPLMESND